LYAEAAANEELVNTNRDKKASRRPQEAENGDNEEILRQVGDLNPAGLSWEQIGEQRCDHATTAYDRAISEAESTNERINAAPPIVVSEKKQGFPWLFFVGILGLIYFYSHSSNSPSIKNGTMGAKIKRDVDVCAKEWTPSLDITQSEFRALCGAVIYP